MIIRNVGDEFNIEIDNYIYTLRVLESFALNNFNSNECFWFPFNKSTLTKSKSEFQHCHGCFFFDTKTGNCKQTKEQFYITGPCEVYLDDVDINKYFPCTTTVINSEDIHVTYNFLHVFAFVKKEPVETPLVKATKQLINDTTMFFKAIIVKLFIRNK